MNVRDHQLLDQKDTSERSIGITRHKVEVFVFTNGSMTVDRSTRFKKAAEIFQIGGMIDRPVAHEVTLGAR